MVFLFFEIREWPAAFQPRAASTTTFRSVPTRTSGAPGSARWWLRDLTIAMGHADYLDLENLTREALSGAKCWRDGDHTGASSHLRAAFELLTQARERFYPVDSFFIDVSLLDISLPAGAMAA